MQMIERVTEVLLPYLAGVVMAIRRTELSEKAERAEKAYLSDIFIGGRKKTPQVIIGMIGLVGSGKSSVAKQLATTIGAMVVEADAIRVKLRKEGESYKYLPQIVENIVMRIIRIGDSIILDMDLIDLKKRAAVRMWAKETGIPLVFIRTYVNPDVMFGRMLTADYKRNQEDFFGGAKIAWNGGTDQQYGAVAKFREAWRRTPNHYRWDNEDGGKWIPRKLPFRLFADIDTADFSQKTETILETASRLATL